MWNIGIVTVCLYALFSVCASQTVQDGQCNENIALANNFNPTQFLGNWYETRRTPNNTRGDCSIIELTASNESSDTIFYNSAVNENFLEEISASATHQTGTANYVLNLPSSSTLNVGILIVQYGIFAVAYNCENIGPNQRAVSLWVLSRTPSLPDLAFGFIDTNLNNQLGIRLDDLDVVEYSDDTCFVLPVIEEGDPIVIPGQCDPDIPLVQNFDVNRFSGLWHETASYESPNSQGTCARAEYSNYEQGTFDVLNSEVVDLTLSTISGTASVPSDGSARLTVVLQINENVTATQELLILATDYEEYALSYSCQDLPNNEKRVYSWILSRSRQLSSTAQESVNSVINSLIDLNHQYYQETNKSDSACFYYPEPVPGEPVVFRGQCDLDIQAVSQFNVERYTGLWHDTESYPSVFQFGTCNNAHYSLSNGLVHVLNTQVVNETLASIDGVAVIASTDGSGLLNVTFPAANSNETVTLNYWVLDTDYDTYALVYSCENIDHDERRVWSWKLSRSKELPSNASQAITNSIANIQVLDQRYYEAQDQSEEGCFYFPDPVPGRPVVFPGQCDESIDVVNNFNLPLFEGIWHEIQSYPVGQDGQCRNHHYESQGNGLNLQYSSIVDQFLRLDNGTVAFDSNSGDAKLTINISINGTVQTIPFWVLITDYIDYALAYGCENIDSDFRRIWSWKLSRTKELSSAANTVINNLTSNIQVLGDNYYEDVDQSDEACFFLPELLPGEPVILFGQCDPNITVVQNFNATRFEGRWRLIESYPADFQDGTCIDTNYALNDDATIVVYNTQVIDQSLQTFDGSAVLATTNGDGKLLVSFPGNNQTIDYWILDTDYENYLLAYSCENLSSDQRRVWSWKLSRTTELSASVTVAINEVVNSINVLNNRYFEPVDNTDEACFYFPIPGEDPVVFRGQCDENITVVANFNAERYMGWWHDIESYPAYFQTGTCSNAYYTYYDGSIEVVNTQVINQTLNSINGTAVLASDDSAKLIVTFPVGNTNETTSSDYWILATDYDSYSLVYSCENIDNEHRQVHSWKLSRTRFILPNASELIENAMNSVQVLDQRYYIEKDQNDSGCFYYPEPQPGVPVVFPGQCDENIAAVENFNFDQFQGTWHEIEAYPTESNRGNCINHQYSLPATNNAFDLQTLYVTNQTLNTVNGNLLASSDSSGRFVVSWNSNGTYVEVPFWVISTDYTDYALVYSCVNVDNYYRSVSSWKLSRTRQLSPNANAAINNATASIPVLENIYYEAIDQSDEACFYLPDLQLGEPVIFVGQCDPDIAIVENFDVDRYQGRWRFIESYASDFNSGTCNDVTYSHAANDISLYFTQVSEQALEITIGSAELYTEDGRGVILVNLLGSNETATYWILDTDYDNYALMYSCVNIDADRRRVWSWKLSRGTSLSPNSSAAIDLAMENVNVLDNRYFQVMDHSDEGCFYFPTPDGNPVVFRGQCDPNITVVENFNSERYAGLWHDIESYPSVFQDGTCNNARYTLNNDVIDVLNTQVLNETLNFINGEAVAYADGSGRLLVRFPVAHSNETAELTYWVLDTDYDNYSLVYACEHVDEEYKQVWSWKLSRTKNLSPAALTLINNVTDSIQILDERYYVARDQSAEGCFYYPDPQPGLPVVFPGQCNLSIPVVENFDLIQFQGTWHEISAYPAEQQNGQCVNHQFESGLTTGNLIFNSYNVVNLTILSFNGSLESSDASARFTVSVTINETELTIPFWILGTDYTSYALAYSCVNIDEDYRAVWSWQLSRSRQLSQAANVAINNVISSNQVLEPVYYEDVDQSDEACFYLPDLEPGEPVIFVGQCENVAAVANFNVSRYLGRWRLIESYPSDFQTGTCYDTTFSLGVNGIVDIENTQVIDETLDSIVGSAVASVDGTGRLWVTFPNALDPIEYVILDTDYDSYALVYSCTNLNSYQRRVWSWKLSRTLELSTDAEFAINEVISNINVLDDRYYIAEDNSDASCFYYPPVPEDDSSVIFRGQCDETIGVVTDFDVEAYMDLWYDIESYPQPFQFGTCPTATYTLTAEGVEVRNTQVVRLELDSINGTAVLATNDTSAKLEVTFPIAGTNFSVTSPYWVLATDYDSYALVYSCVNIDSERRRVSSWKLSRNWELTAAANAAIDAAMSDVQVLRQQYFNIRGHSEDDCFYYPDNYGGPVYLDGQCEYGNEEAIADFSLSEFSGPWHEVSRFPSQLQNGECAANEFSLTDGSLSLTQTYVYEERLVTASGPIAVSSDGRGVLQANLIGPFGSVNLTLYVLDTDYGDFALLYSCRNVNNATKQVYSWKLSRTRSGLSANANDIIDEIVANNDDLFERYYQETDQSDYGCFYYPVFDPLPTQIILPGPCNNTITGKANFNVNAYLGRWFELARYPQPNQPGACSRAEYSLGVNIVDVMNTEVLDTTLLTQVGTAVASDDGSGLLNVTFVLDNGVVVHADYYVIETDYNNFALVYSCRNTTDNRRIVSSWQLSRGRYFSAESLDDINSFIEYTQGLSEEYYVSTSQRDEDCFYLPDLDVNSSMIFRGQCEDVTGVQGFDIQRYLGWWHEIERYPSEQDLGECISSQFQASGNSYQVVDTLVFGLTAQVNSSVVVASSDGRLRKTFSNGDVVDLWVLATDYENYSLLYSCENINSEYRRVWSAKHSKSRALTPAAQDAMAPIIADHRVLYPQYYLPVDQSDDACFHYPQQNGQTVIIPGQCDVNIPRQSDFDPGLYTGTWYQVERYPQSWDRGNCSGSRYTYNEDSGLITILNWEVLDGVMETGAGTATVNSTDGSARLIVVLPGSDNNTVTAESYILSTDYVSYSLVYICTNVNQFQRAVSAWKYSRSRTLPALSNLAIDALIEARQELHQPYFIPVGQNDECWEPSGALWVKSSVLVFVICFAVQFIA